MVVKTVTRGMCAACAVAALIVAAANAQSPIKPLPRDAHYVPARTADGQPDIQGTWVNFDDTPFEASGPERRPSDVNPPDHWSDHGSPVSARRRSMVVDPPDGRAPILPAAEAARDNHLAHVGDDWIHE